MDDMNSEAAERWLLVRAISPETDLTGWSAMVMGARAIHDLESEKQARDNLIKRLDRIEDLVLEPPPGIDQQWLDKLERAINGDPEPEETNG